MKKEKYRISGMTCAACVSAVERSVCALDGIKKGEVNLLTSSLTIEYDETKLGQKEIIKAVRSKGYGAEVFREYDKEAEMKKNLSSLRLRICISVSFMIILMYIAMGKMLGLPLPSAISKPIVNGALQFALALPVFIINYKYFTVGFMRLFRFDPNMDSLIATGSAASIIYSIYAYIKIVGGSEHGEYHLYVDSAVMILTLITVGKFLEMRAKHQTSKALQSIEKLCPEYATVIRNGKEVKIKTSQLVVGDTVIVMPGDNIPSDGIITKGNASINCAVITGESLPVDLTEGNEVSAGTTNLTSSFEYRVTTVGSETTLGKMISLVEDAVAGKAPIARLADKVSSVFVPTVIAIAIISAIGWFFATENIETSLSVGVSVLVIACPCSLGLATPTAIMAGTGKGAQHGVLFRSAEALEILCKADTVILDKTGTITEGIPQVIHSISIDVDNSNMLTIAASLESRSEHPIASAIVKEAESLGLTIKEAESISALPGYGIKGVIDEKTYLIGNSGLIEDQLFSIDIINKSKDFECQGHTVVRVGLEENGLIKPIGIISLADKVRKDSASAIRYIENMGINTIMLTGDNNGAAQTVANTVKISSYKANTKPQDKEFTVRELKDCGHTVVMIGDGVNDAPALARADIGVAIGSGTDIAIENSDVVLVGGRLSDFCNALKISRSTMRVIRQNLFWAFFYNCIGISLAIAGIATPMIAAAAMSLSSVSVVSNALRLRFVKLIHSDEKSHVTISKPQKQINSQNILSPNTVSYEMLVEGMMCEHCKSRVEGALNAIDSVNANVELEKNTAYITCSESIPKKVLKEAVENAGYQVIQIK